jgi:ribosomal protein S12 methylthiotransferase
MQRGHSKEATIDLLHQIKSTLPEAALRTTLIVGFPGETDEEFTELLEFIREFQFDRLGVFTYSPEEGTKAHRLEDNVPEKVKHARMEEIMALQQKISLEINQKRVGRMFKTIIDRKEGDYYIGRTEFDSPEVDNEMIIDPKGKILKRGHFYPVLVSKADYFDLFGMISQI